MVKRIIKGIYMMIMNLRYKNYIMMIKVIKQEIVGSKIVT